ncbi:hypothetical protein [Maricaulis sp.]|uniref:hypothetical protein n=1 Tax=Maricaulis sp. TaxID=1486257 RepID=UPI002B273AC6|nr:hypothetical protein [Maricaulis sp.]
MRLPLKIVVLALSLAAFAVRGVIYGLLGSVLPLAFILGVLGLMVAARLTGRGAGRLAVRCWGVCLVIYGLLRLGLAGLLAFAPVGSPHAIANTGWVFMLVSALYLAAGAYLVMAWRARSGPVVV